MEYSRALFEVIFNYAHLDSQFLKANLVHLSSKSADEKSHMAPPSPPPPNNANLEPARLWDTLVFLELFDSRRDKEKKVPKGFVQALNQSCFDR